MATNFVQEGNVLDWYNAGSAVSSGDVVQVGFRGMGVALTDIGALGTGSVMVDGVFEFDLDASDTAVIGGPAWWDGTKVYNDVAAGRFFLGHFSEARSAAAGQTVGVKLAKFADEPPRVVTLAATGAQSIHAANLLGAELVALIANSEALTVTLPAIAAVPVGALLRVYKTGGGAHVLTLATPGAEQVGGGATYTAIDADADMALLVSTGTAWQLLALK